MRKPLVAAGLTIMVVFATALPAPAAQAQAVPEQVAATVTLHATANAVLVGAGTVHAQFAPHQQTSPTCVYVGWATWPVNQLTQFSVNNGVVMNVFAQGPPAPYPPRTPSLVEVYQQPYGWTIGWTPYYDLAYVPLAANGHVFAAAVNMGGSYVLIETPTTNVSYPFPCPFGAFP